MRIRTATINDLDKIRTLNSKIFEKNSEYDEDIIPNFAETEAGETYFKEAISNINGCFFVAEEKGVLIGYVNGGAMDIPYRMSKYCEIQNLGVIPAERRKGLGSQLLHVFQSWARDNGFQKIYLESYIKNKSAVYFYKKHGFNSIDISLEKVI